MKSHQAWVLAICGMLAVGVGQAAGQYQTSINDYGVPTGVAQAYMSGNPYGQVVQASHGCDSCAGMGCDGCLGSQGIQFGGLLANRGSCGGCGSNACDGGCSGSTGACGCGGGLLGKLFGRSNCGGSCGAGGLGGGGLGGGMRVPGAGIAGLGLGGVQMGANALRGLNASQYGGYDSQLLGAANGPFGNGGCCAPRHFDVHAEWMYLKRDRVSSDSTVFSTEGVSGIPVLSVDDLAFDHTSGMRITGAYILGPATTLEATYFGSFNWTSSAAVTSANNLFSVFSNFGVDPLFGYPETDQASLHQAFYGSQLDNGELNLRHRWTSANCLLHGSSLAGVRYVSLGEDFRLVTQGIGGDLDYLTDTENDMVGFQLGGDMFVCVSPRFKFGGELKAGIFGNRTRQTTRVTSSGVVLVQEQLSEDDAALVSEGGVIGLFRVTPRLTIRGGYQMVYLNGVALAVENFNAQSPINTNGGFSGRTARLDHNGDALYHGVTLGAEWTW